MSDYNGLDSGNFFFMSVQTIFCESTRLKLEAFEFTYAYTFAILNRTFLCGLKKTLFIFIGVLATLLSYFTGFQMWSFLVKNTTYKSGSMFNPM